MPQLGIALLLDGAAHNAVRRLQLLLAHACGGNPALRLTPHVTLKQPFHARALDAVEAYFDVLAPTITAPTVRLHGFGFFDEPADEGVAYVDVTPHPGLEATRRRILAELGDRFRVKPRDIEDDRYHFHATLGYHFTPAQLHQARSALDGVSIDLTCSLDTLGLFYFTGDLWIVYKVARLGT